MTKDEHRQRHIELHKALDELFADFMSHHPEETKFTDKPIIELIEWSHRQTTEPDEPKTETGA
jgi:hypothetical protein